MTLESGLQCESCGNFNARLITDNCLEFQFCPRCEQIAGLTKPEFTDTEFTDTEYGEYEYN